MSGPTMARPIVLTEASVEMSASSAHRDLQEATQAARRAGFHICPIPSAMEDETTIEAVLSGIPELSALVPVVWIGFIPDADRYREGYELAAARNLRLVNSLEQHLTALEFDRAYPLLTDLTPTTVLLEHPNQWKEAETLGYPVFLKGSVRSRKEQGWSSCVAGDAAELEAHVNLLFRHPYRSRGKVLVRRLERLRHVRRTESFFPIGREFRVFLYRDRITGMGYYWPGDDPLMHLSQSEEAVVRALAEEVSKRLAVPFLAVDIGQTEDGRWIVIEVGDAQFAGYAQTPLLAAWTNLYESLLERAVSEPSDEHGTYFPV